MTEVKRVAGKTNSLREGVSHAKREASMKDGVSNFENQGRKMSRQQPFFKYRKLIYMTWLLTFSERVEQVKEWWESTYIYWTF